MIIDGDDDPSVDHDFNLMIDDWRLDQDGQIDDASFGSARDWSHAGTCSQMYGNGFRDQLISQYPKITREDAKPSAWKDALAWLDYAR
mgnify:CR=1 FL=1